MTAQQQGQTEQAPQQQEQSLGSRSLDGSFTAATKQFDMMAFRGMWDSTATPVYSAFRNSPAANNK